MNSHFKYKLHIQNQNIELLYDDVNTIDKTIREFREVKVLTKNEQLLLLTSLKNFHKLFSKFIK